MIEVVQQSVLGQYEAAFSTLESCISHCPESHWSEPVGTYPFRHVCFHALFFADLYLCGNELSFRSQPFHHENAAFFNGYEELQPNSGFSAATRSEIVAYLGHCRTLAQLRVTAETTESLATESEFSWLDISRLENHIYNVRHIHHHAAQLSLRLRVDHQIDIRWFRSR